LELAAMTINRRTFLLAGVAGLAAVSTHGARALARTWSQAAAPVAPAAPVAAAAMGAYGGGVRAQVFEVIVRQAMAGAPWKEICAGPMMVNNIKPEEIEAEALKRKDQIGQHPHNDGRRHAHFCPDCRAENEAEHSQHSEWVWYCKKCDERLTSEHPHHSKHASTFCQACSQEMLERRKIATNQHASHIQPNKDCDDCWRKNLMELLRKSANAASVRV